MEVTKGRNLLEHQAEIMSRPARTWFQTSVEKIAAKSVYFLLVLPFSTNPCCSTPVS